MPIISFAKPQCSVSNLIYLPSVVLKYFDSDLSPRHKCQAIFCLFVSHSLSLHSVSVYFVHLEIWSKLCCFVVRLVAN